MTKTITIRSCHVLIAIWIVVSILPIFPINYYQTILNSVDEKGCRISLSNSNQIICPDQPIKKDDMGNLLCSTCGDEWDTMTSPEGITGMIYALVVIEIMIQIVAFFCWNVHFKWFRFEIKSCWSGNESKTET